MNYGYTPYSAVTNGSYSAAGGPIDGVSNRIRTVVIPFSSGETIKIENGSLEHGCGMWNGSISSANNTRNDNSWITHDEIITPTYNGLIVVTFRYPNDSNISPSNFDGSIKIYKKYLKDRVDNLSENTKNLFDVDVLSANGITIGKYYAQGTAATFNSRFGSGVGNIGITFDDNTQYVLSGIATNNGDTKTGKGLAIKFFYTDETYSEVAFDNNSENYNFSLVSDAGKTIQTIGFGYYSTGSNLWTIENIQIEKGTTTTEYIPYITAVDYLTRNYNEQVRQNLIELENEIIETNENLDFTNENLPWFQTYPISIFSHGQVLYGSGVWSDTITRWGTKDLQYATEDIYLSIKDFTPELEFNICYFNQYGTYLSWSNWQLSGTEYKIPAGSYYKITISRTANLPDVAPVEYIYQLIKNTGLRKNISENFTRINNGVKIIPQLVGGSSGANGRDWSSSSVRNRYKTMLVPKYLYKGSYFYSDTEYMFRYRITKFNTKEPTSGTVLIDNYPLPTANSPVVISEDGYYMIHFMNYTPGNSVSIDDIFSHVTFGLYSDRLNEIVADFIAGGAGNFAAPGDCTLFIGQTGKSFLVDGALEDTQSVFLREMQSLGIDNPNYVMISHFHGDHLGGLVHLLENGDMSLDNTTVFLPSQRSIDWAKEHISADFNINMYNRFMAIVNAATNITVIRPTNTDVYDIDGICMRIWNADHSIYEGISSNYNDYSLCCYLEYGDVRICMSGDLGPIGMNKNKGKMLRSQIYKADHHGWLGTNDLTAIHDMKKFYSNILPDFIITEDGSAHDDLYQQDTAPLVSWCESNCIPLIRCHENAPIRIFVSKDSYRFATPVTRYIVSEVES